MDQLDAHKPRALAGEVVVSRKQVILIRHGQSIANAAGRASEEEHASIRWLDAPMTALGRSQASSWVGVATTWDVEEVWCSPLSRAMESACRIFQNCEVPINVTPHAREGWWHCTENRGRLAHAIVAGTDGASDERRWPALSELPGAHKLRGLERLAAPIPGVWDPAEEARLMHDEEGLFERWKASIAALKLELINSPAHRIALVCHWGIIEALTSTDVENCTVVPTVGVLSGRTCHFQICPPTMTHPPLGIRAYEDMIMHCALPRSPRLGVHDEDAVTLATRTRAPADRVAESPLSPGV